MKFLSTLAFPLLFAALLFPLDTLAQVVLFEDFESGSKGGYAAGTVELDSGIWMLNDALLGRQSGDLTMGSQSVRLRDGHINMEFDVDGAGEVRFYHANSQFSNDGGSSIQLQYSQNGGASWTNIGDEIVCADGALEQAVVEANIEGNVRFRIIKSNGPSGARISIDNFEITEYQEPSDDPRLRVEVDGATVRHQDEIGFGTISIGTEARKSITLTNTGLETLSITTAVWEGDPVFSLDGATEDDLEQGESVTFSLVFEPASSSDFSGTLSIASNDPDHPQFELSITGRGLSADGPIDIAEARNLELGTIVTVTGWVTVADELSGPIYFQDETAGIAAYYTPLMRHEEAGFILNVSHGDSVVVRGALSQFNDMIQISPVADVMDTVEISVYPEGNRVIEPAEISVSQLESGEYQGQLVRLNGVSFLDGGAFDGDSNYDFTDGVAESEVRISSFTDIPGLAIPNVPVDIVGAVSRFRQFIQVFPRSRADIIQIGDAPLFVSTAPFETAATSESITFEWETDRPGTSEICYGETSSLELGCIEDAEPKERHTMTLEGLDPATIYSIKMRSVAGTDTSRTTPYYVTTSSSAEASQEINVYFNQSVDHSLALHEEAVQNFNYVEHYARRIFEAEHSIDMAFYSTSGDAGNQIATLLSQVHEQGVEVRVILDHDTATDAVRNILQSSGVPVIESDFGTLNSNRDGIHHNKFAIIDYRGGDPGDIWLITSSWNATDPGTHDQYQNMIEFQDPSIAGAYTREFDQMWGSTTTTPDPDNARFGEQKRVVNPSVFWIGDSYVRLYFSPQGGTERAIIDAINNAEHSINVATMLVTRFGIANAMQARHNAGVTVRGLVSNVNVTGSVFDNIAEWADFIHFPQSQFGLLHHKYAIFDGEDTNWNGTVLTGSHNWSGAADRTNDENTLVIRDSRIANLYMQEFSARYTQAGGTNPITVDSETNLSEVPARFKVHQNYPNPFNPATNISFELPSEHVVNLHLYDAVGRRVATLLSGESLGAGIHSVRFDASSLASGIYIYRVELQNGQSITRKMTLIK
ncbi:phospholipase D-like domain-containing protein [Balneolales bacterium ANBcel1]|nr:phospholipase D-like domain-containing protein [Balneolales bacterium ANBcel1]